MAGIFKAYDIRGIYERHPHRGRRLQDRAGLCLFSGGRKVRSSARNMRPHSESLFKALAEGLTTQGADVVKLGCAQNADVLFRKTGTARRGWKPS